MFIPRKISEIILQKLEGDHRAILLYGPRQVGKTTLIQTLLKQTSYKTLSVSGDEHTYIDVLSSRDFLKLSALVSGYDLLFIDEAQKIPDIGINLKILLDRLPQLKIIATGSSSFDLASKVNEPLTGRAWSYTLFPISFLELQPIYNEFELKARTEERLIYGSYPEIFSLPNNEVKKEYLEQISNSYLYKDILELSAIKNTGKIRDLLKLLAFQIGNEVSLNELGRALGMGKNTVESYIDLLEKSFVVFRVGGFSRNLRKEVTKMSKIYFYDLGIRNVIIDNLKDLKDRNDSGQLWENFLVVERMKFLHYSRALASSYFWRTYTGSEIDYVEERDGVLHAYEFKYGSSSARVPKTWQEAYPGTSFQTVNQENFVQFVTQA